MLAWVQTEMPNTPAADLAGLVEDFRGRKKILGTYVDGLLALTDLTNSVHASFNLAGTSTGRLSCNDPALQTIPQMAGPAIRRAFVPPPGYVWMKADYSQLELRVAAYLSQDSNMIQAFIDERDIHSEVAAAMFQIDPNDVSKKQRYAAKFVDFGVLYGRGAFSIAYGRELRQYHWTEQMAQEFIDNYLNEFSRLRDWMAGQRRDVLSKQELSTPLGRIRRWPFIHQSTRGEAQRQALNFPIQSTASDITLNALIHLHSELLARELLTRIVITVHDEIDLVVKIEELPEVVDLVYNCMENRLPLDINVPIKAEIEIGPNWADVSPVQETQWYWHSESDSWVPAWDVNDQHAHIELTGPCSYDEMSKRTQIRSSQKQ
jgi:DNA polymerase-1